MTESIHAYVKRRKDGRLYLEGIAEGEIGKYYCIEYSTDSDKDGSVGNSNHDYTYFKRTSGTYDMSDMGCYIPDYGNCTYGIYLLEVEAGGCDTVIGTAAVWHIDPEDLPPVEENLLFGMSITSLAIGAIGGAAIAIIAKGANTT